MDLATTPTGISATDRELLLLLDDRTRAIHDELKECRAEISCRVTRTELYAYGSIVLAVTATLLSALSVF